tara:strand:- start:610 stop:975 length:366 start_codon:yes stop_codon:yes gene_type:complete
LETVDFYSLKGHNIVVRILVVLTLVLSLFMGVIETTAHAAVEDHLCPSIETSLENQDAHDSQSEEDHAKNCDDCRCCHSSQVSFLSQHPGFTAPASETFLAFYVQSASSFNPLGIRRPPRL